MLQTAMYNSKKYPYPSTPKGIGNSMGVGFGWGPQRIKNLKKSTKLNWNFLGGGGGWGEKGVLKRIPSERYGYCFPGTTH